MAFPTYDESYLAAVTPRHLTPEKAHQKVAFKVIQTVRGAFDVATGYSDDMTEAQWLRRMIFLETVAGVPGMVAGMLRHLRSLRRMERDNGWINTLLQEAENERMHLLTFMTLRNPGILFRSMVILAQGAFFNAFFLAYLVSPRTCHALVGYLEEEAVKTYTHALKDIDAGKLWPGTPAPAIAASYWRLPPGASMRDVILAVRADEAGHSSVNHTFSNIPQDGPNPFRGGSQHEA
ncbi:MAG: mitochondrial alternative oxidase [Monoraphidium minutum]|nr:MAG: mitochondrial alternative oxidase [Monoraphidium minutum]